MLKLPTTRREWLIQPNNITEARYKFNERQENILTLVYEATHKYMNDFESTKDYLDQTTKNLTLIRGQQETIRTIDKDIKDTREKGDQKLELAYLKQFHSEGMRLDAMVTALDKNLTDLHKNYQVDASKAHIKQDLFGENYVTIIAKTKQEKSKIIKELRKMVEKTIQFKYQGQQIETVIFPTWATVPGELNVNITISKYAAPFLTYHGNGVGATHFDRRIALTLPGMYNKRMYKLCRAWRGIKKVMSVEDFREMLSIPKSYRIPDIRRQILDVAAKKLKAKADVYFKYEFSKRNSRSFNFIEFRIMESTNKAAKELHALEKAKQSEYFNYCMKVLTWALKDKENAASPYHICQELHSKKQTETAYYKFKRYENNCKKRKIKDNGDRWDWEKDKGLIFYILEKDFAFKINLKRKAF